MAEEQRTKLVRCERHGLAYDPALATGCTLCRAEARGQTGLPRMDRVLTGLLVALVILLVLGVMLHEGSPFLARAFGSKQAQTASPSAGAVRADDKGAAEPVPPSAEPREDLRSGFERKARRPELPRTPVNALPPSGTYVLHAQNSMGRSGALLVPLRIGEGARPLLILFHGSGASGMQMLNAFRHLAEERGVVVLAPDSGRSPDGAYNWQVPDRPGESTPDQQHVRACLDEVFAELGAHLDPSRVLAVGHSGGGSSAAYLGTNDARVHAFAVLHGGVFAGGLGPNLGRAWFSTGADDTLRPPAVMERAAAASRSHATTVSTRVYPGSHTPSDGELHDVMVWWLGA